MDTTSQGRKPRRGDQLEGTISAYDRKGMAQGHSGEYSFSLRSGVPGDRWSFEVHKRRRHHLDARSRELLEAGEKRVEPRCQHALHCGGCSFQECDYELQLEQKGILVRQAFEGVGLTAVPEVEPVLGCANPWSYRNKMEFTFANRRWVAPEEPEGAKADFALGLHAPGLYLKVIDLSECRIVFEEGERILASARRLALEHNLSLWDIREHQGLLRHLVLRHGVHTGEVMVNIVTSEDATELFDPFAKALLDAHPAITTLVQAINTSVADVAKGERERVIFGPGYIEEELLGSRFRISPNSFFQTNTLQAERLFEIVREQASLVGGEVVYDLYSGAGTIALMVAPAVGEVLAFEQVADAVEDARQNARRNGVENVRFFQGDVLTELDATLEPNSELPRPDVVIVDPPRAGLHPKVPGKLLELAPDRIVYVSCNIYNGAKDLALLVEGGFEIRRIQPVDLFPHTPHVECVVTLVKGSTD